MYVGVQRMSNEERIRYDFSRDAKTAGVNMSRNLIPRDFPRAPPPLQITPQSAFFCMLRFVESRIPLVMACF
jgi:hypothetical protein